MSGLLEISNLTIGLPDNADRRFAVEQFSVSIGRGETLCVVGESGSGKTMTAHAVMGLLPKSVKVVSGVVRLDGQELPIADSARMREIRGQQIGMIFQEPMTSLNPVMRIGHQLAEVFMAHGGMPAGARDRIFQLLDEMGLPDPPKIAHSYPHQLSGGQRQRVMIAMALALNPKLLIADEPTTALDVTTQAQILQLIAKLQRDYGTSVMFITHDFGVVRDIADRVVVLQHGVAVEHGTAAEVLDRPSHPYSQTLMAAVPSITPPAPRDLSAAPELLNARHLHKGYGASNWLGSGRTIKAVDDVTLAVRRGETLGIVGESGSGKSTTARCIARLIKADSGEVDLNGLPFLELKGSALRQARPRMQMVFQDPFASLNPRHKIGRIIAEGPIAHGMSRSDAMRQAKEMLEMVGLPAQAAERYPHEFSGGQRQRVGIARAIAMKPEVLIADEAVSALDVSVQARILELFKDLQGRLGLAMIFVTHDLRVAAQICDRIAVMSSGRVVELETAEKLFADPKHEYTRRLLASVPGRRGAAADADLAAYPGVQ